MPIIPSGLHLTNIKGTKVCLLLYHVKTPEETFVERRSDPQKKYGGMQ